MGLFLWHINWSRIILGLEVRESYVFFYSFSVFVSLDVFLFYFIFSDTFITNVNIFLNRSILFVDDTPKGITTPDPRENKWKYNESLLLTL